jgi:dihydrofolate reductase
MAKLIYGAITSLDGYVAEDGFHVFVAPVVVGGGKTALPADVRMDLELVDERRFAGGFVHLHYLINT